MDVNRAQGIAPVQNQSGSNAGREHHEEHQHEGAEDERPREQDAFEVNGLAAEITPAAQKVLDSLAAEIEPLRRQLEMAHEREQNLREDLARHSFLPVPGRREFVRELNHVLNHLGDLAAMPSIALLHVANAEDVRRRYGRDALDRYLVHVANGISRTLQPTDVLGSLGGSDFAVILLGAGAQMARERAAGIVNSVAAHPFNEAGETISPKISTGVAELSVGSSSEASIRTADRDLLKNA
ncbi:MAG: GGDEF domain-containing protein [Rhodospirillales bacterium]|nr:GGDEF domain-containing protein [Rhodospirillales bacterium]MBO6787446.1 GGDEF domain-containing protein [Rhodospirillales bacterium]